MIQGTRSIYIDLPSYCPGPFTWKNGSDRSPALPRHQNQVSLKELDVGTRNPGNPRSCGGCLEETLTWPIRDGWHKPRLFVVDIHKPMFIAATARSWSTKQERKRTYSLCPHDIVGWCGFYLLWLFFKRLLADQANVQTENIGRRVSQQGTPFQTLVYHIAGQQSLIKVQWWFEYVWNNEN